MANKAKPQIDGDMCSQLLEIGKSIRDANANFVPKRKIHFYGTAAAAAITHKFPGQQLGSSAVLKEV